MKLEIIQSMTLKWMGFDYKGLQDKYSVLNTQILMKHFSDHLSVFGHIELFFNVYNIDQDDKNILLIFYHTTTTICLNTDKQLSCFK